MSGALLEVEGLSTGYGSATVVRRAGLEVREGEVTCLLGRNGVGKTTFLKAMMGLLPAWEGTVRFRGEDLTHAPAYRRARLGFAYVPQGREILPQLSVEENIRLGGFACAESAPGIPDEIFAYFPGLRTMLRRRAGNLSGGQQQQLAFARALMARPRLLLLDEPTEGIQPNLVEDIRRAILAMNRELGLTVLLVEQKMAFVRSVAQRYYAMDRGEVLAHGPMAELDDATVRRYLEVS